MPHHPTVAGVALLGVRFDEASSFLRGAADGPPALRAALHSPASNLWAENGVDLGAPERLRDLGDLEPGPRPPALERIAGAVEEAARLHPHLVVLGGDHSVTYPVLQGLARIHGPLQVLHFDAHPDLYDALGGDRLSHACPFARALEEGLVQRLVQLGIRTLNDHQRRQGERFGVEMVAMDELTSDYSVTLEAPAYLSFDLDALDPACAPGVSHHEPGGLSTREALGILHRSRLPLVAADVVELNPRRDVQGITAAAGAKLVKEIAGGMLRPG